MHRYSRNVRRNTGSSSSNRTSDDDGAGNHNADRNPEGRNKSAYAKKKTSGENAGSPTLLPRCGAVEAERRAAGGGRRAAGGDGRDRRERGG